MPAINRSIAAVLLLSVLFLGCQKDENLFISNKQLNKALEREVWRKSMYYHNNMFVEFWTFTGGNIIVREAYRTDESKTRKMYTGTYSIKREFGKGVFVYIHLPSGPDRTYTGTYEPIRCSKKYLKLAANGREDDDNIFTIEGGLKMLEFIPR